MTRQVKQYIFFDFEMLCSKDGMSFESMEAIRLGAVKYDLATEEITTFDRYIKPVSTKPLSNFCKELTGIRDEDLVTEASFDIVFQEFLTWIGGVKKSRFFSWSPSDLSRLKIDAKAHNISCKTIKKIEMRYVDFQEIFTKRVSKTNASVESALQLYGLHFIGAKHNPMYDAFNTLRIYLTFLHQPLATDLIMLRTFIFEDGDLLIERINTELHQKLSEDLSSLFSQGDVYKMKDATKLVKKARNLVKKYNNILINRSKLFNKENLTLVEHLIEFYQELVHVYEEHRKYSSKIIILDQSFSHSIS
ncbi:3'-5' exonuclease [Halalkalibacter krulwichiae]|uniref:Exonuclease n=1 Tax=Halalkalibacter krulwichiae TaxID=199441 RepID=A0A1X9MFK7_9BACI|nr:3'-5' exonuclease [Halalkalibacter krulwichiae]ARK30883.1 exonuclease [Halalkalibacter krulwichiae]